MNPAAALLLLKALLDAIPLVEKQVEIFKTRGEYSEDEWSDVKAKRTAIKTNPAWVEEPDPTT